MHQNTPYLVQLLTTDNVHAFIFCIFAKEVQL